MTSPTNSRKTQRIALLGLALVLLSPAVLPAQISLATVVDQAQRNSGAVKLAQADLDKAQAALAQTRDVYVPNLIFGSSIGPPSIGFPAGQPSVANASIQSLAFSFPQKQYIAAARAGVEAATLNLKDAREQVALDATLGYLEMETVAEEWNAARRQSEFAERLIDIERQRADAGIDPLSELLQAKLTAAQLKLKLVHLEARAASLTSQLSALTGLPSASLLADPSSIPQIPELRADPASPVTSAIASAQAEARSKSLQAHGDFLATRVLPLIAFGAQYNRDATSLNNYNLYYGGGTRKFKADNFSTGFSIQIPIFDLSRKAKAQQSAAEALRATLEAEQAQRQNELQIATLNGNLRELDALAQIAALKQQIAAEQLKSAETQLQLGNGAGIDPGAAPQLSPKAEQLAQIDWSQKAIDALDATFDLNKARLNLLRALGHMDDWLQLVHPSTPAR